VTGTMLDLWPDNDDPAAFEGYADLPLRPALELDDAGRRRRAKTLATLAPLVLLEAHKGLCQGSPEFPGPAHGNSPPSSAA
jgi:hypothetical protein